MYRKAKDPSPILSVLPHTLFFAGIKKNDGWCDWSQVASVKGKFATSDSDISLKRGTVLFDEEGKTKIGMIEADAPFYEYREEGGRHVVELEGFIKCDDIDETSVQERV